MLKFGVELHVGASSSVHAGMWGVGNIGETGSFIRNQEEAPLDDHVLYLVCCFATRVVAWIKCMRQWQSCASALAMEISIIYLYLWR
eukprot:11768908-Ditylum_brightwellii.AAC.1